MKYRIDDKVIYVNYNSELYVEYEIINRGFDFMGVVKYWFLKNGIEMSCNESDIISKQEYRKLKLKKLNENII